MIGREAIGHLCGKVACLLMAGALIAFSVRLHWHRVITENGVSGILSNPSELGFYLAFCSLVCVILWFVLAVVCKTEKLVRHEPHTK